MTVRIVVKWTFLGVEQCHHARPRSRSCPCVSSNDYGDDAPVCCAQPGDVCFTGLLSPPGAGTRLFDSGSRPEQRTTIVIRQLPRTFTRDCLSDYMDSQGFNGRYDFVHVPIDFKSWLPFGYAIVNMVSAENALSIMDHFNGITSPEAFHAEWCSQLQGLEACVERYRNSSVMHSSVEDCIKPALFSEGHRMAYPMPTKGLRRPKYRRPSDFSQLRARIDSMDTSKDEVDEDLDPVQ